jgi:hypothetical protein
MSTTIALRATPSFGSRLAATIALVLLTISERTIRMAT